MRAHHLQVLQLSEHATRDEIKSAFRELSKRFHPDVNPDASAHDKFLEIKAAYEYLANEKPEEHLWDYFEEPTPQPTEKEVWRKEQRRKNREREQEKLRQQAQLIARLVAIFKPVAVLILAWNVLLAIDYTIPFQRYDQEILAVAKGYETSRGGSYYRYDRVIFEDFEMKFDKNIFPGVKAYERAAVEATRIFRKPMATYITINGATNRYEQVYNIYIVFGYVIPVVLIISGLFFYLPKPPHRLNVATLLFFLAIFQLIFFLSQ